VLVLAYKNIDPDDYKNWSKELNSPEVNLKDYDKHE